MRICQMTIEEILNSTEHRPWDLPKGSWKFYQEWNKAIFLHYKVDLALLRPFVPAELEIDLIEGEAWVSVVTFTMEKIRPKYLPHFPPISNFDEINIRTYVKFNGKTGVYFLSIEGGKSLSCKVAKGLSELPYRYSQMERSINTYHSSNLSLKDRLALEYELGAISEEKTALDKWLTERYALFQDTAIAINEFEIHHLEWPMVEIKLHHYKVSYPRFKEMLDQAPDLVHYSNGVKVLAWGKQSFPRNSETD